MTIDTTFPGGNIILEGIDGDTVRLRPDLRTTTEWWFYWHFRVRGAQGRTVRFQFDDERIIGSRGPCFSAEGQNWRWLGRECVKGGGFAFTFPDDMHEAYFAMAIPYVERHLQSFLNANPQIECTTLTTSEQGRVVKQLMLRSRRGTWLVPLTARTHACESMGSYTLEGILSFWLSDAPEAAFLREHVDFWAVPFIDTDGVEAGDQGKLRAPHDHNRDFIQTPLYEITRAFKSRLAKWNKPIPLALDLHCPWISHGRNEEVFLVGSPEPWATRENEFTRILQDSQQGELRYNPQHTLACGREWNTGNDPTLSRYIRTNHSVLLATTFEVPYAVAGGQTITAANVRAFGEDLARAISLFIQQSNLES